jgi:hypothetical protein
MKMFAKVQGLKRSKGVMNDTGKTYDSTTVYVEFPFARDNPDMRGSATEPMKFGTSENFEKFNGIPLPFEAEIDIEVQTNGNRVQNVIIDIQPVRAAKNDPEKVAK